MAATIELVRRMALALPGVQEGVCHGTPAFYVRRKLMLRLWEDGETLVVRFPKEKRAAHGGSFVNVHGAVFVRANEQRGSSGNFANNPESRLVAEIG